MKVSVLLSLSLILILSVINCEVVYKKIINNIDPEAKCLDGSPGALYVHQGSQKDKFLIYFIGGGFCGEKTFSGTLQSCYQRSKTMFGSSNLWPQTIDQKFGAQGYLSLNSDNIYQNWTKVLFAYCDGALHQGGNIGPVNYKNTLLYFRGGKIVRSHFQWLIQNYQLNKASKILLTGGSAGALGAYLWSNYLQGIVDNPNIVYTVPDSGIFLQVNAFKESGTPLISLQISNVMKLAHIDQKSPLPQCNIKYYGQQWKCLFIHNAAPYLKGKYLFINSQYDTWTIPYLLQMDCLRQNGKGGATLIQCSQEEMNYIEGYRSLYLKQINLQLKKPNIGIWSIACSNHVYASKNNFYDTADEKIPGQTGVTVKDVIRKFVLNDQITWIVDSISWPGNKNCAF